MIRIAYRNGNINVSRYARLLLFVTSIVVTSAAVGADFDVNKNWRSIAIKGYDPVAYFTLGKAVKGHADFEFKWQEARWRFSSQKHKEMFTGDPDKYAPQFGGFCAGGISLGQKAPVDPQAWLILDGKLYLNYDKKGRDEMAAAPHQQVIDQANENWKTLGKEK